MLNENQVKSDNLFSRFVGGFAIIEGRNTRFIIKANRRNKVPKFVYLKKHTYIHAYYARQAQSQGLA